MHVLLIYACDSMMIGYTRGSVVDLVLLHDMLV
jgi:hypothetical protein